MAFLFALFIVALSAFVMVIALLAVAAITGSFGGHRNLKKIEPEQPHAVSPANDSDLRRELEGEAGGEVTCRKTARRIAANIAKLPELERRKIKTPAAWCYLSPGPLASLAESQKPERASGDTRGRGRLGAARSIAMREIVIIALATVLIGIMALALLLHFVS